MAAAKQSLLRIQRQYALREAEGFLELEMPAQALRTLTRFAKLEPLGGRASYLRGEALRALGQYREALIPLLRAAEFAPSEIGVYIALGWCYKRIGRIDEAITAIQTGLEVGPRNPLLHYNLACYYSLEQQIEPALTHLRKALEIDERYRDLIDSESDFDNARDDPRFQALIAMLA